jgi:hypothetical protein
MNVHMDDMFGDYLTRTQADSLVYIRSMLSISLVDGAPTIVLPREYCSTLLEILKAECGRRGRDRSPKGGNNVPLARARAPSRGTAQNRVVEAPGKSGQASRGLTATTVTTRKVQLVSPPKAGT